jgi:hypothetical protein
LLLDWNYSRLRSIGCASVDRILVSELAFLVTSSPASSRVCQSFLLLHMNWKKGTRNESTSSGLAKYSVISGTSSFSQSLRSGSMLVLPDPITISTSSVHLKFAKLRSGIR